MTEAELREFLGWFKGESERHWAKHETKLLPGMYPSPGYTTSDWYQGTRWQPYTEPQVAALEKRWGLDFPWDYRLLLQVLGTPDQPQLASGFRNDNMVEVFERDGFMSWRADDIRVADRLNWPVTGLIEGTERPWWWTDEWEEWQPHDEPLSLHEAAAKILMVAQAAPPLTPFYSHRFLIARHGQASLCLSIYGSDVIVYAYDLRLALVKDFSDLLSGVSPQNLSADLEQGLDYLEFLEIPFWGRFL